MGKPAPKGHNNPPDPLDEAIAPYADDLTEAENWLDGKAVTDAAQMDAVDAINKAIKAAKKDVTDAQKSESAPLHDAWKAALARYKPTIEDLDRISKGLTALVGDFKRKLAAEKAAAEKAAWEAANKARRDAEALAAKANAANIEQQREAEAAKRAAIDAEKAAQSAKRDTRSVKGLRKVTGYQIEDHRAALHWIAGNDKPAMTEFIEAYVAKHHNTTTIPGVKVWQDKEAF